MKTFFLALALIVSLVFSVTSGPAFAAGAAEAREAARLNNCTPKKVEVFQQSIGREGKTIYRVSCTMPKIKDDTGAKGPDALLIQCDGMMCVLLRSVAAESK